MEQFRTPRFIREPGEVYRSKRNQFLTSHQLIDFTSCPKLYKQKQAGLIAERIGEFYGIGIAAHTLILEGREAFDRECLVSSGPINPKTDKPYGSDTKKFSDWASQQTKIVVTDDQYALICQLAYSVHSHPEAKALLSDGTAEGVLRSKYFGVDCQIRLDWYSGKSGITDLKTCDNLDKFESDCREYHYDEQMAFYQAVTADHVEALVPVHLIAVEKREPYRCGVWLMDDELLHAARMVNEDSIARLIRCRQSGEWPTGYEEKRILRKKKIA